MNFSIQKEFLKEHSEYLGRRNYYSIDENGKIIKKDINFALILSAYSDNWEDTKEKINREFIYIKYFFIKKIIYNIYIFNIK